MTQIYNILLYNNDVAVVHAALMALCVVKYVVDPMAIVLLHKSL